MNIMDHRLFYLLTISYLLISCNKERVLTPEALKGVSVDWSYGGWNIVKNETNNSVTLTMTFPSKEDNYYTTIPANESIQLEKGCSSPGNSVSECTTLAITLEDGTIVFCDRRNPTPWSDSLFNNFDSSTVDEFCYVQGVKVKRTLSVDTYHINQRLIGLWTYYN